MPLLNDVADGLSHLLFPRLCAGCAEPLSRMEDTLCLSCYQQLPLTSYHLIDDNEAALRFAGRIPYQHVTSLAHYVKDGLIQHLIKQLKYKQQKTVGTFLGRQLGMELGKSEWHQQIELILPIPLHPRKQDKRGFNQSLVIAEGIGESLGKEVSGNSFKRTLATESQVNKSREERVANMSNAFSVPRPGELKNKHILLIDDVLTTGATLEAAALSLLKVPGVKISMATVGLAIA